MNDAHGLSIELLRVLDALLTHRHVTRAASRLDLTQSATSHALARLRRHFGDPLFVRGPKGMVATERAESLGPEVRSILERIERLTETGAAFDPARMQRRFVIGAADYAEVLLLPALMTRLERAAPGIDVVVRGVGDDIEEPLARGALDVAIGVYPRAPLRLVTTKLLDEEYVCLFRKRHPALRAPLTAASWASLRHLLVSPRGDGGGPIDDALGALGLTRRLVTRTATFQAAPWVVEGSDTVTTLPRRLAERIAQGRRIELVKPPTKLRGFTVSMAFHERSRSDPGHRWIRDQLVAIAREA